MCARIGTKFAGYRIEALIGRGGWSTVYRAESPRLGIRVALKILNAEVSEDEAMRERFVRESRLAAGLNHPNVITIYDAGAWHDDLFIAMRYVAGGDLKQQVRQGPLEPRRALGILAQVASGLDAAHEHGLVHRDVKPANIMLDSGSAERAPEIAYVTDFGLIRELHAASSPTKSGELLGTIDYIAPEQIEGGPIDGRADVYALGCVAYECFTGHPPFVRENEAAVLWAHMKDEPPPVSEIAPELPEGLEAPIARAMAKDRDDRFDSCFAFATALNEALDPGEHELGTVILPRPEPAGSGTGRRVRIAAVAVAALALGAAGAAAAFLAAGGDDPTFVAGPGTTRTVVETQIETLVTTQELPAPAYIPEIFRGTCKEAAPPTPDFDSSFICHPRGTAQIVRYSHAASGGSMLAHLRRRLEEVGLQAVGPKELIEQQGSCDEQTLPAIEQWVASGRAGHDAVGTMLPRDDDGRILCYMSGRQAHVEWTTKERDVYAHAYGPSFPALLRWWGASAGPAN